MSGASVDIFNPNETNPVRSAVFSPCRLWRYVLRINWDKSKPILVFIMLNPSTADEKRMIPQLRDVSGGRGLWGMVR